MPAAWIVEAVDVFEDRKLCGAARGPSALPQQLSLDRLEEGFDRSIIIAISGPANRPLEAVLAQDFLIVVRAVLAAAVRITLVPTSA